MLGWIVRGLLFLSGVVTSWFVARDAVNFESAQMVVAILLFTFFVVLATFWPAVLAAARALLQRKTGPRG